MWACLGKGNAEVLSPSLLLLSQNCRTLLDTIVRQDLEGKDGPDVGSLSELINLGVCFGANPEHLLDWLQGIVKGLDHIHHTQGQNVPKFPVHLMKSISDFAGRMSPCLTVSTRLTSAQVAIVTVSTLLSWKDQHLRSSDI